MNMPKGVFPHKPWTEERKRSHSAKLKAKNMVAWNKGMKMSPEHGAAVSAGLNRPEVKARLSAIRKGIPKTDEQKAKFSAASKRAWADPDSKLNSPEYRQFLATQWTPERRAQQSAALKGRNPHDWTPESKVKLSKSLITSLKAGTWVPKSLGYQGKIYLEKGGGEVYYRSSFEKAWYQHLNDDPAIKRFYAENVMMPYQLQDGTTHHYLVDVKIRFTDGHRELWELKFLDQWKDPVNQAKWKAAEDWCARKRSEGSIITFCVKNELDLAALGWIRDKGGWHRRKRTYTKKVKV